MPCVHVRAFAAVVEMVGVLGLAPWDSVLQKRPRQRLPDPVLESLRASSGDMVSFTDMAGAAQALDRCALSDACVSAQAEELLEALLDLHVRAWTRWASRDHIVDTSDANPVNAVAARRVLMGKDALMERFLVAFAEHSNLLAAWLDALQSVALTGDQQRRLTTLWPGLMDHAIPTLAASHGGPRDYYGDERLVEALLPVPPNNVNAETWPDAQLIERQVGELIASRASKSTLVNQLIRYLASQSREVQLIQGLDWFLAVVIDHETQLAGRTRLASWLRKVRDEDTGHLPSSAQAKWQRLVDALAATGDEPSIRLQQEEE